MWPFGKKTADRVSDAIKENKQLSGLGLNVQEKGGTVTLSGIAPSQAHVNLARIVAEGVNGVKSVDVSGVSVQAPAKPSQPAAAATGTAQTAQSSGGPTVQTASTGGSDQELEDTSRVAKEVLSAIRGNAELKDDPIDVLQSGKSVILRGVVDSDHELRLAEQLARGVSGVAGVDVSGLKVHEGAKELAKEKDEQGETVYTVKAGDTLSKIAQRYYGDLNAYHKIAQYNGIANPDHIEVGQKIRIPA
ncbi:Peptidoglycan-binding lysin domain protein [Deinococcus proteolyticus MRP]|uniref:Peptidoglycan-binding lysin domain protein n=1 Tax=Deinococcus proteolyticus (strain ATCC 35074 / DSM 20540 / JCM 6276 / NBRC 101906 / NCIMB 13154 / VKM Ac-1939 / CCM 2703 / MRP) TaxID=693977 RepID=F0RNJ0_DEIPM|nr:MULTISPECIES: BON domain-containing protein [Deinococcus]ADY26316.1 Peptidoglycan-binding lysin domain protein [Deinococcus proteolyticus MRP]MCY1702434.1 BON domain-containing protein [Deinococcus sp. SL84]